MSGNTISYLSRYVKYNSVVRGFSKAEGLPKIVVNSVPKSGTHLLMKALQLMPNIKRAPIDLGRQRIGLLPLCLGTCPSLLSVIISQFRAQKDFLEPNNLNFIPIDVDSPFYLSEKAVRQIISLIQAGWFAMGHVPYSDKFAQVVTEEQVKMIVILRDPRDVIVSHGRYLAYKSTHYMNPLYQHLSKEDRIMTSIMGAPESDRHPKMLNIRERLEGITAWKNHDAVLVTSFEKLIGPHGEGSGETQVVELQAIANHIGLQLSQTQLTSIANNVFGGTRTFREGTIGRWRQDFDKDHRQACKELIGDYLIELGYENGLDW